MQLARHLCLLTLGALLGLNGAVMAQETGTLTGTVSEVESGKRLIGAQVVLDGTQIGDVSDRTGRYVIPGVKTGDYTLVVTYLGYETVRMSATVKAGSANVYDVEMKTVEFTTGDVLITGLREGQVKALNQQKTASNIKNIVAADAIGRFPDLNTAEALQRIPGTSVQRDQGEGRYVLIRGTEARLNSVQINGERVPSPEGDIRSVALDVIPSDALASIEVSKAITPDMDGDAIGGSINLITKSAFDYNEPIYKLTVAGGYNDIVGDLNYQAAGTYGTKLGDDSNFGVLLSASYFRTERGSDNNEMEWILSGDLEDFPDDFGITPPDGANVIGDMQLRDYVITRERLGISSTIDYKLDDNSKVYIRGLFNQFGDQEYRRRARVRWDKGDYTAVNANSGAVDGGKYERELKNRYEEQTIWSLAGGGEHLLSNITLGYNLSYSYAEEDEPDRRDIGFATDGTDLTYDVSNPDLPAFSDPGNLFTDYTAFEFDELVIENNLTTDQDFTAALNLEMPYSLADYPATVKIGGKFRAKTKDRVNKVDIYDDYEDGDGNGLTLDQVLGDFEPEDFLDNSYTPGRNSDPDKVDALVDSQLSNFEYNAGDSRADTDPSNYEATEDIIAAYAMTTINFGELMVLPGVRMEMTSLDYTGNVVEFDEDGDYASTTSIDGTDDYTNILPMLHARYRFNENTNLRAAYTTTIARPNYYDLAPYRIINREDEELEVGNPSLNPTSSMNIDLMAEHYIEPLGIISLGVFYKSLTDVIYPSVTTVTGGDFDGWEQVQPLNADDATLMGVEVAWEQQLTFLPGELNGLGIYANYTWTDSETQIPGRDEKVTLPGQSEHTANVALSYEKHGVSARISLNLHGSYLDEVGDDAESDIFYDNHMQVDFSASYLVADNIRVFAELLNLTDEPLRYYVGTENRPIVREFYSFWSHFGVKVDL